MKKVLGSLCTLHIASAIDVKEILLRQYIDGVSSPVLL